MADNRRMAAGPKKKAAQKSMSSRTKKVMGVNGGQKPNRMGAEGPKKSMKANPYGRTWRPTSKASEGPKKRMPRKKK